MSKDQGNGRLSAAVHPRYAGPVIDAHCHYDVTTRTNAASVNALAGLTAAIHLWDLAWPPVAPLDEAKEWGAFEPGLMRCHVPDLSHIGAAGFEQALANGVRDALRTGCVGIKVWKNLGLQLTDDGGRRLNVDDPRLDALWDAAAEAELPILIHVGDHPWFFAPIDDRNPRADELRMWPHFWWGGGGFPTLEQIHEQFEKLVSNHPRTVFIGAHFGCFMHWSEVDRMLADYPNYRVDTSAAVADMGAEESHAVLAAGTAGHLKVREIILKHPDRIIFGTDLIRATEWEMPDLGHDRWNLRDFFEAHWRFFETAETGLPHPLPFQGNWTISGLDLPDDVLHRLYYANAAATFRLPELVTPTGSA